MKLPFITMMLFLVISSSSFAAKPTLREAKKSPPEGSRVIKIDELEVTGDVRRPLIEAIDSDQVTQGLLPSLSQEYLLRLEKRILESPSMRQAALSSVGEKKETPDSDQQPIRNESKSQEVTHGRTHSR